MSQKKVTKKYEKVSPDKFTDTETIVLEKSRAEVEADLKKLEEARDRLNAEAQTISDKLDNLEDDIKDLEKLLK